MKRTVITLCLFLVVSLVAKDWPKIKLQVVASNASERQYTRYVPGTAAHSTTTCDGNATATSVGDTTTANGSENCATTTTPGRPATTADRSVPQIHVRAIMPDGKHVTLWCQSALRHCEELSADTYDAELDGNSVWVSTYDLQYKMRKAKYGYVGGWY
jgi:hypothetical protein